jgi:hypothetical protein
VASKEEDFDLSSEAWAGRSKASDSKEAALALRSKGSSSRSTGFSPKEDISALEEAHPSSMSASARNREG